MAGTYKCVMVGGGGVGKSAISIQFIQNHFVFEYDPTIEDTYRKQVQVDDEICILEVLDTAGQEEYSAMREQWIRYGEGFFLVYSIINRASFDRELAPLITQIKRVRDVPELDAVPMVLFGNKCDLEAQRQVSYDEGKTRAQTLGAAFFEGSAKTYINLDEAYFELVRRIRRDRRGGARDSTTSSMTEVKKRKKERVCSLL